MGCLLSERGWCEHRLGGLGASAHPENFWILHFSIHQKHTNLFIKPSTFTPSIWRVKEFYDYKHFWQPKQWKTVVTMVTLLFWPSEVLIIIHVPSRRVLMREKYLCEREIASKCTRLMLNAQNSCSMCETWDLWRSRPFAALGTTLDHLHKTLQSKYACDWAWSPMDNIPEIYSHIVLVGVCHWVCKSPTLYNTKFYKFCDHIPDYKCSIVHDFNLLQTHTLSVCHMPPNDFTRLKNW